MRCRCFRQCKADEVVAALCEAPPKFPAVIDRRATRLKRQLTITTQPIDESVFASCGVKVSSEMGAVIYFLGSGARVEGEKRISAIEYEAFQTNVVEHQSQSPLRRNGENAGRLNRSGSCIAWAAVKVNEPSLWVEVVAPHRSEAFAACQWLIDEMKRRGADLEEVGFGVIISSRARWRFTTDRATQPLPLSAFVHRFLFAVRFRQLCR